VTKVSAIISTYNNSSFFVGCIKNLLNQSLFGSGRLEIVVIDSGSDENEGEIVRGFQDKHPEIKYIRTEKRESIYKAWNRGIKVASGEYITNANTDDRHENDCLEKLANALDRDSHAVISYGDAKMTGPCQKLFNQSNFPNRDFFTPSLLLYNLFGYQPMWKAHLHSKIGYFNEHLNKAADYDFGLRISMMGKAVYVQGACGMIFWGNETLTLADSTMGREIEEIKKYWLADQQVQRVYNQEGFSTDSSTDKSKIYHDLGNRFLCYFPQWKGGQAESEPGQSIYFFQKSLDTEYSWGVANNLAVAFFVAGKPEEAASYLKRLEVQFQQEIVRENLKTIQEFILGITKSPNLILTCPYQNTRREDEMALYADLILGDYKKAESTNSYAYCSISMTKFWHSFLGRISPKNWQILKTGDEHVKVFIYGAGIRGQIFLNQLKFKGIKVTGFIDQNESRFDTVIDRDHPITSLENTDFTHSIVIVMTGKAHWVSIHAKLKKFLKPEYIWFPSYTHGGTI